MSRLPRSIEAVAFQQESHMARNTIRDAGLAARVETAAYTVVSSIVWIALCVMGFLALRP